MKLPAPGWTLRCSCRRYSTLGGQYYLYASYESKHLKDKNPEIPDYD